MAGSMHTAGNSNDMLTSVPEVNRRSHISDRAWQAKVLLPSLVMEDNFVDIGTVLGGSYSGIFSPRDEVDTIPDGVTSQFLENPEDYHHAVEDTGHAEWLLKNAFQNINHSLHEPIILDVGCGSGNTAFALANIFNNSVIVAADVSKPLLKALVSYAETHPKGASIVPVCLDLNKPWFKDEKFNLVVGRAILHHLFDPEALIMNVYRSIKPGGSLIFFEPYECGTIVFGVLLELIIESSHRLPGLDQSVRKMLEVTLDGFQKCEPKPFDKYKDIDDKWNFTRTYFERIAVRLGASLKIYNLYPSASPYTGELQFRLKAALGRDKDALPDWAWALVDGWEKRISRDALDEMSCAAGIILTKSAN